MPDLGASAAGAAAFFAVSAILTATTHGVDHRMTLRLWCLAFLAAGAAIVLLAV